MVETVSSLVALSDATVQLGWPTGLAWSCVNPIGASASWR